MFHEPPQLPLREDGVLQVQAAVLIDVRLPDPQCAAEPRILGVPVVVLRRTERVRHTLKAVHYGAGKVIGGIHSEIEEVGGVLRERIQK